MALQIIQFGFSADLICNFGRGWTTSFSGRSGSGRLWMPGSPLPFLRRSSLWALWMFLRRSSVVTTEILSSSSVEVFALVDLRSSGCPGPLSASPAVAPGQPGLRGFPGAQAALLVDGLAHQVDVRAPLGELGRCRLGGVSRTTGRSPDASAQRQTDRQKGYSGCWADRLLQTTGHVLTCPELAWEWEPMLWLDSSLLTLSRVGMLPLERMLLIVPMVPIVCSFSRLPRPSVSRCSAELPATRPWEATVRWCHFNSWTSPLIKAGHSFLK